MKQVTFAMFFLLWPLYVLAQAAEQEASPNQRVATVLAGVGNPMGSLGVQVDYYFHRERLSAFAGAGYTSCQQPGASGITFAAGVRAFTGGRKHRALFEVSISMLGIETLTKGGEVLFGRKRYGPGLQVGYQYAARNGITFMGTIGVGYGLGLDPRTIGSPIQPMASLGAGYTWR